MYFRDKNHSLNVNSRRVSKGLRLNWIKIIVICFENKLKILVIIKFYLKPFSYLIEKQIHEWNIEINVLIFITL